MTVYVPGTEEKDPKNVIRALQNAAKIVAGLQTDVATAQTDIATLQSNVAAPNYGLASSGGKLGVSLSSISASLGADVALNASTYTDGPSIAQGTTGTWLAIGCVSFLDTAAARNISLKLWDGTTVIDSCTVSTGGASFVASATLMGFLASPAANLRISAISASGTTAKFLFNQSGNSKDSTITALRVV